jgi:hypothetical protein
MSGANVARADMFVRNRGDKATGRAIRTRCASSRGLAELDKIRTLVPMEQATYSSPRDGFRAAGEH